MEKKIIRKEFKLLVNIDGPKRNAVDITVKRVLICTRQT